MTGRRVLVVDDDIETLDALALFLEQRLKHVRILTAERAAIALARVDAGPVDVVVTDYNLPDQDGLSMLAQIRQRLPGVPAVLITGERDMGIAARAVNESRIEYFFTKPLDHESLAVAVAEALWESDRGKVREELLRKAQDIARAGAGSESRT